MLTIDGAAGEGGGQVLRSALALSVITGTPFRIARIRARRRTPGLRRQHLTAVKATADISHAEVTGAELDSQQLTFVPHGARRGRYTFDVGTAGSAALVLQTVLLPLLMAGGRSTVTVSGGTHNPMAPSVDYLAQVYLPLLQRMGLRCTLDLEQYGFFPAGGGRCTVHIEWAAALQPLDLRERGALSGCSAEAVVANLPAHIGRRELRVVQERLGVPEECCMLRELQEPPGPGNVLMLRVESEHVTEMFTGFGERGVRAETVAERVVTDAEEYLNLGAPVGPHLADQLLLPLAVVRGGVFRTGPLSAHAETNLAVIHQFLDVEASAQTAADGTVQLRIAPAEKR